MSLKRFPRLLSEAFKWLDFFSSNFSFGGGGVWPSCFQNGCDKPPLYLTIHYIDLKSGDYQNLQKLIKTLLQHRMFMDTKEKQSSTSVTKHHFIWINAVKTPFSWCFKHFFGGDVFVLEKQRFLKTMFPWKRQKCWPLCSWRARPGVGAVDGFSNGSKHTVAKNLRIMIDDDHQFDVFWSFAEIFSLVQK